MDKLQVGEVYTEEGSREVSAIRRWTENTVDFKIIRLLQREVPQNLIIDEDCAKLRTGERGAKNFFSPEFINECPLGNADS